MLRLRIAYLGLRCHGVPHGVSWAPCTPHGQDRLHAALGRGQRSLAILVLGRERFSIAKKQHERVALSVRRHPVGESQA
jgi:hypothetical protein